MVSLCWFSVLCQFDFVENRNAKIVTLRLYWGRWRCYCFKYYLQPSALFQPSCLRLFMSNNWIFVMVFGTSNPLCIGIQNSGSQTLSIKIPTKNCPVVAYRSNLLERLEVTKNGLYFHRFWRCYQLWHLWWLLYHLNCALSRVPHLWFYLFRHWLFTTSFSGVLSWKKRQSNLRRRPTEMLRVENDILCYSTSWVLLQ